MSETRSLPCLSLWQPWARLWLEVKNVENRGWYSAYRGPLLVHAAKRFDEDGVRAAARIIHPVDDRAEEEEEVRLLTDSVYRVHGAVLGMVWIHEVTKTRSSPWHMPGQYGFYRRPRVLIFEHPVALRGQQGLFVVERDLVDGAIWLARNNTGVRIK